MKFVNTHQAKSQLSRILHEVEQGEEYVVARGGKPVARLVPYNAGIKPPQPDKWQGSVFIAEDFDEVDDQITGLFENPPL